MRHEADSDTNGAVARVLGVLVGLGLVVVAVSPFSGVPPQRGSGGLAPAQIEVRALTAGEFSIDPAGTVLEATPLPDPGQRGGPTLAVTVRNITGVPLRVSVRLVGLAPTLDKAVKVRASVAGSVILNGPLGGAAEWSRASGPLQSGQQSTLRMRFRLLDGLPPDAFRGKLDVRQLEFQATKLDGQPAADPGTLATTTTPEASTPAAPPPAPGDGVTLGPPSPGAAPSAAAPAGSGGTTPPTVGTTPTGTTAP